MEREITWTPGIGDPSFMGWFTVAAYLAAAALAWRAARAIRKHVPEEAQGRQPAVWTFVAALFLALAINKQLDLQSLLTDIGRVFVANEGWNDHKATIQVTFIFFCLVAALVAVTTGVWVAHRRRREYGLLVAGGTFTVTFVLIRATSFHHMDRLIGHTIGGVRMNWALELTGIGTTALAAWLRTRHAETGAPARG
jgi:hypothetical protein